MRDKNTLIEFLQDKLDDVQTTIDELQNAAFELHMQLPIYPPIKSNNVVIGTLDDYGTLKPGCSTVSEYYSNKDRIGFLLLWATTILPIYELLTNCKLPFSRNSKNENEADFEAFIVNKLQSYMGALRALNTNTFLSVDDIRTTEENCDNIINAVRIYLDGLPESAFQNLKQCLDRIEGMNLVPLTTGWKNNKYYKMRLGSSNHMYSASAMFHIPFEARGLVKSNRYSIPGLPCVYLGSTPLTCWEEMGRPDLNTTHTSYFLSTEDLSYFDISIPPTSMRNHLIINLEQGYGVYDLTELYQMLRTYLILLPLIACCSIRVMNPNDTFKPEYIVPQLLLQWIQQSGKYDGISYFSTKFDNYTRDNFQMYQNFAFPVKERKDKGICEKLHAKFIHITNAVPWQVFQLHRSLGQTSVSERSGQLEFMPGIPIQYNMSDFGRLETFLDHVMEAELS